MSTVTALKDHCRTHGIKGFSGKTKAELQQLIAGVSSLTIAPSVAEIDTITLTFGDMAENHVGMEQIGQMVAVGEGFTPEELAVVPHAEVYDLAALSGLSNLPAANIIVLRQGVDTLMGEDFAKRLYDEQKVLEVDKKAFMYGRVVNKKARWNLCFSSYNSEPKYEEGKGRVIAFEKVPLTQQLLNKLPSVFGKKAENLQGEGNYYYDLSKTYIGYHGDSERRKVIAVRLGKTMPLYYQWYQDSKPIGALIKIDIAGGDIYAMSEKAVGTDWKRKSIPTLRHAAGLNVN